MYFERSKYSTVYPPVDTNFVNNWQDNMPSSTQCIGKLVYANGTIDKPFYGFMSVPYAPTTIYVNGETTNTTIEARAGNQGYKIPVGTKIYGYTVDTGSINLWTDPTYRDTRQPVMYGQRGLYIDPFVDDVYDFQVSNIKYAILHGYYSYFLILERGTDDSGSYAKLIMSPGFEPETAITSKFPLSSRVISTGTVEQEIIGLQDAVKGLEDQVKKIETDITKLVPDLTKLISAEASKNYVAR